MGVAGMECCGLCCGEDDREFWMRDRISPKIGLSDDDLLDFQSDEGEVSPTPVVHHIHRSQLRRRSRGGERVFARNPSTSHASAKRQPSKSIDRSASRAQGNSVSPPVTPHVRQDYERAPSKSIRSRHSLQRPPSAAPAPDADAGQPRPAAEGSRAPGPGPGPPPTKLAALSAEEKEEEKKRLQALVKEFAREAVSGIDVKIVNIESGMQSGAKFTMNRFLTDIDLRSSDEGTAPSVSLKMQDVKGIFKGDAAAARGPEAVQNFDQRQSLLLETNDGQFILILAENQPKRDKLYTCLKILRLSVDIAKKDKEK